MLQAIKPQSENLHWYLELIINKIKRNQCVHLAIVGRDPYPSNPIGIPFAKRTLEETFASTSGKHLFPALGIDTTKWKQSGRDVKKFYSELCRKGIIFLNVSYKFLEHDFVKKRISPYLRCANTYNKYILERCNRILLCGDADKGTRWANKNYHSSYYKRAEKTNHPSAWRHSANLRMKITKKNQPKRINYWGGKDHLLDIMEPVPIATIFHPIRDAIEEMNNLV